MQAEPSRELQLVFDPEFLRGEFTRRIRQPCEKCCPWRLNRVYIGPVCGPVWIKAPISNLTNLVLRTFVRRGIFFAR